MPRFLPRIASPNASARVLLVLVALAPTRAALAQGRPGESKAPEHKAKIVVFNREITTLHSPLLGIPPAERARAAEARIKELLDRAGPGKVTVQHLPRGDALMLDGELALIMTAQDADQLRGETLPQATRAAADALRRVVAQTREARDRIQILRALALSLLASLVFAAICILIRLGRLRLSAWLADLLRRKMAQVHVPTKLMHERVLLGTARRLVGVFAWALVGAAAYEWASFVLIQFPYTRPWGERLDESSLALLGDLATGVLRALPHLVIAVLIFTLARAVTTVVSQVFEKIERSERELGGIDPDLAKPTRRVFAAAVWLFALVMAWPYIPGSNSDAFKGLSVLIGLMVTLGGTSLFGQAASGLVLMYSRRLRIGEYVQIGEHEGKVTELRGFVVKLETASGEVISLSNAAVNDAVIKNYSRSVRGRGYVIETTVSIGYDTDWRQVEALLIEATEMLPGVQLDPPARVFQGALGDFYVEYKLLFHVVPPKPRPRSDVLSELHGHILDAFNEHGVQIMSPHYLGDPSAPKLASGAISTRGPVRTSSNRT